MNKAEIKALFGDIEVTDEILEKLEQSMSENAQKSYQAGIKKATSKQEETKKVDKTPANEDNEEIKAMYEEMKQMKQQMADEKLNATRKEFQKNAKGKLTDEQIEHFSTMLNEEQLDNFDFSLMERPSVPDIGENQDNEIKTKEQELDKLFGL